MADSILASMAVRISAQTADFNKGLKGVQGQIGSFVSNINRITGAVGVAFAAKDVATFGFEISKLAGEAKGVKDAFDRLPNSTKLMVDLKNATANTVSELDLMKRSVQANNFGIALESLPELLKFAAIRAQQTGQSVDYLVDSIITGIGRKSPLILDNLGISAVRLKSQFGGAALEAQSIGDVAKAVGKIATEELKKMGEFSDNEATKTQQLTAAWTNLTVALGTASNQSGVLGDGLSDLTIIVRGLTNLLNGEGSNALSNYLKLVFLIPRYAIKAGAAVVEYATHQDTLTEAVDKFNNKIKEQSKDQFALPYNVTDAGVKDLKALEKLAEQAGKKLVLLSDSTGKTVLVIKQQVGTTTQVVAANNEHIKTLDSLQAELKELNTDFEQIDVTDRKNLETIGKKIIALDEQIKKINELRKAQESYGNTIEGLNKKLDALNEEYDKVPLDSPGASKRLNEISQEIIAIEALIKKLRALKTINEEIATQTRPLTTTGKEGNRFGSTDRGPFADYGTSDTSLFDFDKELEKINARSKQIKKVVIETGNEIKKVYVDMAAGISGAISSIIYEFGRGIGGAKDFGEGILQAIIGFAKQFGEILVSLGVAAIAAQQLAINPYVAVAAGAALLLLAGAASAALQSSQDAYNGAGGGASRGGSSKTDVNWRDNIKVEVSGEMEIRGDRLVYVINRQGQLNNRTRG